MKPYALSLLLLSCTKPVCITPCGMYLLQAEPTDELFLGQPQWTCDELNRVEKATMDAYAAHVTDDRFRDACGRVHGWAVYVMPALKFQDEQTKDWVSGRTSCMYGNIEVSNESPMLSTLAHEMAHAVQKCGPTVPADPSDPEDVFHQNWGRDGIWAALSQVQAIGHADRARCFDGGTYVGPTDGGVCGN